MQVRDKTSIHLPDNCLEKYLEIKYATKKMFNSSQVGQRV